MKVLIVKTKHATYRFIDYGTYRRCIGGGAEFSRIPKSVIERITEVPVLHRERIETRQGRVTFYFTPKFVATVNNFYDLRWELYLDELARVHGLVGFALVYCRWRELVRRSDRV